MFVYQIEKNKIKIQSLLHHNNSYYNIVNFIKIFKFDFNNINEDNFISTRRNLCNNNFCFINFSCL